MQEWTDVWFWLSPMQSCQITSRFFTLLVYRRWLHPQKQMLNKKARKKKYIFLSTLKFFSQLECEVQKLIHNDFFLWRTSEIYVCVCVCVCGLYTLEWGGSLCHLHLQIVCKLHISSLTLKQAVKCQFRWNDPVKTPIGHVVDCKLLEGQGLYTFVGLIGYCLKDAGE
jgi:hypothetical protein